MSNIGYTGKKTLATPINLSNAVRGGKVPIDESIDWHRPFSLPSAGWIAILRGRIFEMCGHKEGAMAHVVVSSTQNLQQEIQAGPHRFFADEPVEAGGGGTGPDPYSLLLSALGA